MWYNNARAPVVSQQLRNAGHDAMHVRENASLRASMGLYVGFAATQVEMVRQVQRGAN